MYNSEFLQEKWSPILESDALESIKDPHRRAVTTVLLENQERFMREERGMLTETPANAAGNGGFTGSGANPPVAGFDPVLISLIRRSMPKLMAYDICGVQPMSGPTGLIFAMRSQRGSDRDGNGATPNVFTNEAFYNETPSGFSAGDGAYSAATGENATNPSVLNASSPGDYAAVGGMDTASQEALGSSAGTAFREMSFSIEKVAVEAKGRALKAEYSLELAQDLKAIHGLDAEAELANILSAEVLAEINREVVRTIYVTAKPGAQNNVANAGTFDLDVDSNGRWMAEKFKGLIYQIERDANAIGQETRRGKGNFIVCSADVASALGMAGVLEYTPGLAGNAGLAGVDDTESTLVGTLNGRIKVYVDPYSANVADDHFYVMGYKGTSAYDAGLFYCPYVPLQMVRSIGQDTFQPKIGFKTRYGMVANPFSRGTTQSSASLIANSNVYYRRVAVKNLM
tara:strand:- start:17549 stop:18919 length:1371 start_codon:yes stop_codon:yes gene_type:complete